MLKYKLKRIPKKKLIIWTTMIMIFFISLGSIVGFYAASNVFVGEGNSGINESTGTVTVNDLVTDWDYYMGLNYTEIESRTELPGMNSTGTAAESSNKYNSDSLVAVQISYSGEDVNNSSLKGYVSNTERQFKYIYYKYYPIENGYVTIELIDNPFTARPTSNGNYYGFNGWVCVDDTSSNVDVNCNNVTLSYDSDYYVRYLKVPESAITTNASGVKTLYVNLKASWTKATVVDGRIEEVKYDWWGQAQISYKYGIDENSLNAAEMKSVNSDTVSSNNITNQYFSNGQSTVGYYYKDTNYNSSIADKTLYYNDKGVSCAKTNCSSSNAYKLIQSSDSFATYTYDSVSKSGQDYDYSSLANNYYYFVTRDTNLAILKYGITLGSYSIPLTITGNGTKSVTVTLSSNISLGSDLGIDSVYLTSSGSIRYNVTNSIHDKDQENIYSYSISSGSYNLKIGRNVSSSKSGYYSAQEISGGNNNKVIVESGSFESIRALPKSTNSSNHTILVLGSDYDRVTGKNLNLLVYFQAISSRIGSQNSESLIPLSEMIVKSGSFGYSVLADKRTTTDSYFTYGIYAGTISYGDSTSFRTLKIEGGSIFSVNGGPRIDSSAKFKNVIGIYMTGGTVDNIVGGAGTSASSGNRIVSVTGGTVYNAVAGGSNSYSGSGGALDGSTLVYIGGNAVIGTEDGTINYADDSANNSLYGITEKGSVFGAGLGNSGDSTLGRVNNSHVIIDGDATIYGSVYGGGNYGSVGTGSNNVSNIVVDILGGVIKQSVYGASNSSNSGYKVNNVTSYLSKDYYLLTSVTNNSVPANSYFVDGNRKLSFVSKSFTCSSDKYTSSYSSGSWNNKKYYYQCEYYVIEKEGSTYSSSKTYYEVTKDSSGSYSATKVYPDTYDATYYYHSISVNFGNNNSSAYPKVEKSVYGGSNSSGTVYGNVNINLYSGSIGFDADGNALGGAYGGGKGQSTSVYGNTIVSSKTSDNTELKVNEVYGGSELGTVNKSGYTSVNIDGGTITTIYGGGKGCLKADGDKTCTNDTPPSSNGAITVNVKNGSITEVFGGNNVYGTPSKNPVVNIEGGTLGSVYGGSNGQKAGVNSTLVNIKGGTFTDGVYGGGKQAKTNNTTEVNIEGGTFKSNLGIAEVFGGGRKAAVSEETTVNIKAGAKVYNVYGGSNVSGDVKSATVNNIAGEVLCNTYGGGKNASVVAAKNVLVGTTYTYSLSSSESSYTNTCGNAFAGGAAADVSNAIIKLDGSSLINVYGGSDKSGTVDTSTIEIISGDVTNVFGGNNQGGSTTNAVVNVNGTSSLKVENVYGGSNGANASIGATTLVNINSGTITKNVFGGGNEAPVVGSTTVNVYNGTIMNVFGGGNEAHVGDTIVFNGVYSSGTLKGKTTVNIVGGTITKNVYGSGNSSFVDGATEVNIGDDAIKKLNITDTSLLTYSLRIGGSVFGGSETNTDGDTTFDNNFIGVYDSSIINIDGKSYISNNVSNLTISGSINGWGNNSKVAGISTIYIDNFGTMSNPNSATSIQRANDVYITDSYFKLNGTRNRAANDSYKYTLISINNLYLLGSDSSLGTHLYLATGATYFDKLYSGAYVDGKFQEETVTEEDGVLTREVADNRIYMLVNTVLAVTGNKNAVASYDYDSATPGEVHGMTFLGMYAGDLVKGVYDYSYTNGSNYDSDVTGSISDSAYTYVYGINYSSQTEDEQIRTNGFYTNTLDDEKQKVSYSYVGVTPKDAPYYKWVIGVEPIEIIVDLVADKYSESGTVNKNISIVDLLSAKDINDATEWSDAKMYVTSVSTEAFGFSSGKEFYKAYLVDKSEVPTVNLETGEDNVSDANQYFALSMGTTTAGWLDNYKTNFYSDYGIDGSFCDDEGDGSCTNNQVYMYDSTTKQRSLSFWLYHSKNLDFSYIDNSNDPDNMSLSMGEIRIKVNLINPHGNPNMAEENSLDVTIVVRVSLSDGELDQYGALIAPGKHYEIFQGKSTTIAADGAFSIYQSLSLDLDGVKAGSACGESWSVDKLYNSAGYATVLDKDCNASKVYWSEAYRYLSSSYLLPVGTVITMLDLKNDKQYYYEVTKDNYNEKAKEFANKNQYKYYLEDFIRMGSTSSDNLFDDDMNGENSKDYYYKDFNLAVEEFIFTVDFANADTSGLTGSEQHSFYLQLERYKSSSADNINTTGVAENILSTTIDRMVYTIVPDVSSVISTTGGFVQDDGSVTPSTTIYVGEDTDLSLNTNLLQYDTNGTVLNGVSDTIFDDYKLGAKITILREKTDANGNVIAGEYEQVTNDLFGTVMTINGVSYYPQTDGSTRITLAGRITDVISSINIDFENSDLTYGNYILVVETFVSYDGLYYGDFTPTNNKYSFTLLNSQYGLDVSTEDNIQITHDVNTGKDANGNTQIHYKLDVVNGLANPNIKVSLQRRLYNDDKYYNTLYTYIPLENISTGLYFKNTNLNILDYNNSCYRQSSDDICIYYNLSSLSSNGNLVVEEISKNTDVLTYDVYLNLKNGPGNVDLNNLSGSEWKSGTYKVIFTLFDGDTEVGSVYEYLIIRSLGIDEIIEGSN